MPSSIIPSRAALFALLDAEPRFASLKRTFGFPITVEPLEVVALLGTSDSDENAAVVNGTLRREVYGIEVGVKVQNRVETDPVVVEARAGELLDVVRAVVMANRDLSGTVDTAFPSRTETYQGLPLTFPGDGGGFVSIPVLIVQCESWITEGA